MMDWETTYSWTLGGLVGSLVDLVLAYFLLCGSAIAFFGSKVCDVFGICFPCPCCGIFGYRNSDLCLHKLFIESPVRMICYVQMMARSRFPFGPFLYKDRVGNLNERLIGDIKCGNEALEACCSSFVDMLSENPGYRDNGYESDEYDHDLERKRFFGDRKITMSGIRVRRRAALEYGKLSPVLLSGDSWPIGENASDFPFDGIDMTNEINRSLYEREDNLQGDRFSPTSIDLSERSWCSLNEAEDIENNAKLKDKVEFHGNEANRIRALERALEVERAASAALQLELEKERAAAASATDEAMAMMLRLQTEKALLEMEANQSRRIVEDKLAHDEDEMRILMEIIVAMETENQLLERELENYRQMGGNERFDDERVKHEIVSH